MTGKVVIVPPDTVTEKKEKELPVLIWKPEKTCTDVTTETYTMFQESVKQDLQGITYLLLDNCEINSEIIEVVNALKSSVRNQFCRAQHN